MKKLPYRILIYILSYINIHVNHSETPIILNYFYGYFKLDKYRKIFLLYRNINILYNDTNKWVLKSIPKNIYSLSLNTYNIIDRPTLILSKFKELKHIDAINTDITIDGLLKLESISIISSKISRMNIILKELKYLKKFNGTFNPFQDVTFNNNILDVSFSGIGPNTIKNLSQNIVSLELNVYCFNTIAIGRFSKLRTLKLCRCNYIVILASKYVYMLYINKCNSISLSNERNFRKINNGIYEVNYLKYRSIKRKK